MKILSIGNFGHGWDGSICDEEHIAKALEELGHEVTRVQREGGAPTDKDYAFTLIAQWNWYDDLFLQNLPRPLIYWAFDHQDDGQDWHEKLLQECDIYLSKPLRDRDKHPNWRWLSQDFSPEFLETPKNELIEEKYEVVFTGSWVPWESGQERVKILKAIDEKYDLHIFGVTPDQWRAEGFKNVHGPKMDMELPLLVNEAKINFSMDHVWSPGYWSDRNAQIMACGGFVLFRHVPLSEAIFRDGVAYFNTVEGCLESIDYYLKNDNDRWDIAMKGLGIANTRLRATHRVQDMLKLVGEFL